MRLWKRNLGEAYQKDTGKSAIVDGMEVCARVGSRGDIIIGEGELPEEMVNQIVYRGTFDIPDMGYVEWLEDRLVECNQSIIRP
jgi:hypothetical protein